MSYAWRDHEAELELEIEAPTEAGVFAAAADAFGRLVERGPGGEHARRAVELAAADRGGLLVAFLDELVYLADVEGFVPDASEVELAAGGVRASLLGRVTDAEPLVKAATYHRLCFDRVGGRWRARVVLDV